MARVRTVEFLPEIFQTPVNRQFLNATLDQLTQEPAFTKTQGFVGRKVGPGVNPVDKYVVEPTKSRNDYQLEPGVISLDSETHGIVNAITYPGITDALKLQGAPVTDPDSLYTSEYYSWDPFVDFDKFVNYSQYYWLPGGPLDVDVGATGVPLVDNFNVTRANGSYTFSGIEGTNPTLTLVRGGNYTFQVAQNATEDINFRVQNNKTSAYVIDYETNPTLTLVRGNTYTFTLVLDGDLPFYIKTESTLGTTNLYTGTLSDGSPAVQNNGASKGTITFTVPQDAPDTLYYLNSVQYNMRGVFNIVNGTPGTGPGFWIQTDPGVEGRVPATPNISSRDILGVINNGEDLGTVTFNVPLSTAQNFYYSLTPIGNIVGKIPGTVDLITDLKFNEINNIFVDQFLLANPDGIDGIKSLDNKTIVFQTQQPDPEAGGWQRTSLFDPLPNEGNVVSSTGSFDTTTFDQTTDINPENYYDVWQIQYKAAAGGGVYMEVVLIETVNNLEKFNIQFGTQYASTSWYKTAEGVFEQIPLLTAIRPVLWYQDGTDPEIFGQIRVIDQDKQNTIFVEDIIGQKNYTSPNGVIFTNGLKVTFRGDVEPVSYQNNSYYVEGVGTAIKLLPVSNFITPETYTKSASIPYDSTPYDFGNYDASLNAPVVPDYLTINRASPDLNAWTRSNRWFHIDVINASAAYNNTSPVVDNNFRARRPILEYRAGTRLFDFGTEGKQPVDIIDFKNPDAFSTINGSPGYSIDGYPLINGSRVIFAVDTDSQVRNKIYEVQFVTPDTVPPLIAQPIINLVPAADNPVLLNQSTVCLSGQTLQGKSFWFDGVDWIEAQEKTGVNQAPLFDVYDPAGISFSDRAKYPSSTFRGCKLFSYGTSNLSPDAVLGFPLRYLSLANVGDIVFENNLYNDTFTYVINAAGQTLNVSTGFARQYSSRLDFRREIGWQPAITRSIQRQQFQFTYNGSPLQLDVAVNTNNAIPAIQLYVNSQFQDPSNYSYTTTANTTIIVLKTTYVPGDLIEVAVLSDQTSATAFYQIPTNLENNPFNVNSDVFTLGTARTHYETIGENLLGLTGKIIGANNTRDLGNLVPYGQQILQQSSPLTLAGYFMRSQEYDIFGSIEYNSREYIKFKSLLMETVIRNEYDDMSVADILDSAIADITQGRTDLNPFYWSDMLPTGSVYTQTVNKITPVSTPTFNTAQTYDFTSSNFLGLLVYLTRTIDNRPVTTLLTRDVEYVVSTDSPRLTVTVPLSTGDAVTIREYTNTAGNFVPNTPTKLGLYPKFIPQVFYDQDYVNPTTVIQGHDGSITVAFGDIRDEILLEFERRIYDNIKHDGNPIPLTIADVIPGFFRTTDYTQTQINDILSESFLTWVGWNKLDYKAQDYIANNPFTYNYSTAGNKINNEPLLGAWRGIYRYFYDTLSPNYTPWEMLGLSEKPIWWEDRYGPAPYTSDNLVLWDDLEAGLVADPVAPFIKPQYARPGLTEVIPNSTEGQLLNPLESVVGQYNPTDFRKSWAPGDGGPVEASWWTSSSYPFAIMRLLALTRPAEFFALFADRDLYRYNFELEQYLYDGRYRLDANGVQVYGDGVSKASYINWIVDYNKQIGINSTAALTQDLQNLDVRLCYRMASFTDKQYLNVYVERSSPESTNSSLLLPDDSYSLLLYKNQPTAKIIYSALIVEIVEGGYSVYGYNNATPYFSILSSSSNGRTQLIQGGGAIVRVPTQYTNNVVQVPYGFTFTNTTVVVDFILSYGEYLKSQGLIFDDRENGYTLNWNQMATEFLYFSEQGWANGTIINLNPNATTLKAYRAGEVVDTIESTSPENMLLDQNRNAFPTRNLIVERDGDSFSISTAVANQSISYLNMKFTSYESMVVLDNVSIFSDLVYDPVTAARQNRIKITAATSTEWNGVLDAQGFILNQNNVKEWVANKRYTKGEIVLYKNNYWQAMTIVQPKIEFDYQDWVKSNYTKIQKGLLPNIATKANQLANSYNINSANLDGDNDLLSYGLIGYRPRQYMTDLGLNNVSQINLYKQFLGTKGTRRAAELFSRADLGKESAEYDIFENWGVLVSTYGANANRSFIELRLNEANLKSDPCTVQVVLPGETSQADQTILLDDVWRESYKLTSPDILPTTYTKNLDTALPSAGYVNLDDVDITVFDLNDPANIAKDINNIGVGTTIWAAKSNSYDWDVYRCGRVPGQLIQVIDNLNGTSLAQFNTAHGLVKGDLIVMRYFNDAINGVYRVLSVPNIQSITISYKFNSTNQTNITGTGLVFYLQTMRVAQASDVASLPYSTSLLTGARAYVDDNGDGHWEVLEKQNPFTSYDNIEAEPPIANSKFGTSVSQSENLYSALVGAPGVDSDPGYVYAYRVDIETRNYVPDVRLELQATDVVGYGNAVDFGKNIWAATAASASNSLAGYVAILYRDPRSGGIASTQLLVSPDHYNDPIQFGTDVAISLDEHWLYVTAPYTANGNQVYAYGRVDVESQSVRYRTDGSTQSYNWSDSIVIDYAQPDQIIVNLNNSVLIAGVDYTLNQTDVVLASVPNADLLLIISRRDAIQLDKTSYYNIEQDSIIGTGSGATFTVDVTRGEYNPTVSDGGTNYGVGDELTILGTQIGGTTPAGDLVITVTETISGAITAFTYTGSSIDTSTVFSLSPYLYTATNIYSFSIVVDGQLQRPLIDYTFDNSAGAQEITFITVPGDGAVIAVLADTYWQYCNTITVPYIDSGAQFGISVSTTTDGRQIFIGASRDSAVDPNNTTISHAGSVYVFDRSVVKIIINDTSTVTYSMPGTVTGPVTVMLNGEFLSIHNVTDVDGFITTQFINGQVDIDYQYNTVTLLGSLTVGDVLEIETNVFQQVQKVIANTVLDESAFGSAVDICPTNCSLYIGAPLDSTVKPQAGSVERNVNQSRVYGVTTTTVANPSLTAGDTIRINDIEVVVPNSPNNTISGLVDAINSEPYLSTKQYYIGDRVSYNSIDYIATSNSIGFAPPNVTYWSPSVNIPNVVATLTPDATFIADGTTTVFDIGTTYSSASSYTTVVYVDDTLQTAGVDYTYNNNTQQIIFLSAPAGGTIVTVVSGRMTLSVKNVVAAVEGNRLTVLPGVGADDSTIGSAFYDLGFDTFVWTQKITSPNPTDFAFFGSSVQIDSSAVNLVVGAPNGDMYEPTTFDAGKTYFDDRSTTFFKLVPNSGVVYTYDYLRSANSTITNVGQFVFGQQIYTNTIKSSDQFGTAVNFTSGRLLIGAPGNDNNDPSQNYGIVTAFNNPDQQPAWKIVHEQQPAVDVALLNGVFMYDRLLSSTQTYFDFFDPLQGKILGAARRNIDYIGAVDPANYNAGTIHNQGNSWGSERVGQIWWDTNTARFIDPNQDDIVYASRKWGQTFPGSRVDIYQWVASDVTPISYTGPGTPLSTTSYTVRSNLNEQNIFVTTYYFWVRGIATINTAAGKTLSSTGIASYIENPRSSGIPYIAALNASTVAVYNGLDYISAADTILHIDYDREYTDANIHTEYQLIADGKPNAFLSSSLYRKFQDSLCGVDSAGAVVPDPFLSPAERYGVQFRPRQSMFVDRFMALENYLGRANNVLSRYPIAETKKLSLLNSAEPEPIANSGAWDKSVANLEELSYQDIYTVPLGYLYLVVSDSSQNGLWTIYEVADSDSIIGQRLTRLVRVQTYDTRLYWDYIDWYMIGYNSTIQPIAEVPVYSALDKLSLKQAPIGSSVKVTANAQGKFEIYLRTILGWDRVGLQDGTIQFKEKLWNYSAGNFGFGVEVFDAQYFDQEPATETRKIIQAINEELFVDDLAIERNSALMLMFNYVYSEFAAPNWLIRTSLIDVNHRVRALLPYQNYLQDNQTFVLDYLQEVKPYHVQVREFNLSYNGMDDYLGNMTDFDVPAYWNSALEVPQYISPVLTPYTASNSIVESFNSDAAPDAQIWTENPWSYWFNNYLLEISGTTVINGGSGYTVAPDVTVTGDCIEPAEMTAVINSAGRVVGVNIVNPGAGYSTTATITFTGGNGSGAVAVAVMGNGLVRNINTTIKYDRCEYTSDVTEWSYTVASYPAGSLVRYVGQVWEASDAITNTPVPVVATGSADANTFTVTSISGITVGMLVVGLNIPADTRVTIINGTTITINRVLLNNINYSINFYNIFDPTQWAAVPAETLSGADRTMGFYEPTPNQPGLSLPLLVDGIDYPGVQVSGPLFSQNSGFDVGNYDINPFDNISYGPEGRPTYDPAILNAIYESEYLDPYLGTRPTDVNVDGGAYVDTYSSHAPEELIPGAEFDTLDFRVYTRPGADWTGDGHGFAEQFFNFVFDSEEPTLSFAGVLNYPAQIIVYNQTTGLELILDYDYTSNWPDQTITILNNVSTGNIISIGVYGVGGGNQLYQQNYNGEDVGNTITIPVTYNEIQNFAIFVNGVYLPESTGDSTVGYTYAAEGDRSTTITFDTTYTFTDFINLTAIGPTTINGVTTNYSWSTPQTQVIVADGSTLYYDLDNSLEYTNPDNLIVTVNGNRARTSAGIEWYGDGSTDYLLPDRLGFSQSIIADNEVHVYVNEIPQILGVDFTVEPYTPGDPRSVQFFTEPAIGARILICVDTLTQCYVNGTQLVFVLGLGLTPVAGDVIAVTTWNDTRQQNILTKVIVGPITTGATLVQPYDSTDFDSPSVNNPFEPAPGEFDYSAGTTVTLNDIQLGRVITDPSRLWVTLNGYRLFFNYEFTISGEELILSSGILKPNDVLMISEFTNTIVPEAMAFRIFQDMRGVQATYRITPTSSTPLTQPLLSTDDIIYVADASALGEPDLATNIWGVIMVNGERIMYRERNTVDNTVSSLLRGTAGTAIADHDTGAVVTDLGRGNLLALEFQNYIVSNTLMADGSTTEFIADNINLLVEDSTIRDESVEVYVAGIRVESGYTITGDNPCTVEFDVAPVAGVEVTILVRRGVTWYNPGLDTPSNGVPLQDTDNQCARFLRGGI